VEALEDRCCLSGGVFEWDDPTGGALDPTFGSGGQVINSFVNHYDAAQTVTTQSDGKIVIAGNTSGTKQTGAGWLVARYNTDGSVDTSFDNGGYNVIGFSGAAQAVALQPQTSAPSKILLAGTNQTSNGNGNFALARLNANGTLDTTFGSKGKVTMDLGGGENAFNVVVDSAGRILVSGTTDAPGTTVIAMVRYTANGALDTTFGSGGKLVTNIKVQGSYSFHHALALQSDSKIVVAGVVVDPATKTLEFVTARFNANGTVDTTFGSGGSVLTHAGSYDDFGGVAIQADGKILLSGSQGDTSSPWGLYLVRYNANGTLDTGFGTGGIAAYGTPGGQANGPLDATRVGVVIQPDGEILAGGSFGDQAGQIEFAVARVNPDSSMDPGFGNGGWATITVSPAADVRGLALQPDGRILLAGYARPTSNPSPTDVALVRFLASAPQIGSFTANPNPVPPGSTTTLSVSNITDNNPGATVAQVAFYIMIDGTGVLLGYGTKNSDGSWSYAFDTTGYAPGTYTLYAQATDSYGVLGNPVALTLTIQ
jgi:uncharacterized delta-60 repeat protein